MDTKWVHASGDTYDGECVACACEDEEGGSDPHEAERSSESTIDEPFCDICGHDIDLISIGLPPA